MLKKTYRNGWGKSGHMMICALFACAFLLLGLLSGLLSGTRIAHAQDAVTQSGDQGSDSLPLDETTLLATAASKSQVRDASVQPESLTSLFFTAWQHALLQEAKIGFNTNLVSSGTGDGDPARRDPGLREISLGGIAFTGSEKWTVWLNGVRVTPTAIPAQILDIKVSRAYVDVKWFDGYTNKIYPIRLRPQERFNLDTRIFLPGTNEGAM